MLGGFVGVSELYLLLFVLCVVLPNFDTRGLAGWLVVCM